MARLAKVKLTPEFLCRLLKGDRQNNLFSDLPKDTRVVIGGWDYERHFLWAILESESFNECPEGCEIPVIEPLWAVEP